MRAHVIAMVIGVFVAPAAAAPRARCRPDRYVLRGATPPGVRLLALSDGRATLDGACGPAALRRRVTRRGTILTARWRRCGAARGVVLRALFRPGGGCDAFDGTLRTRGRPAVPVHGVRSACGDGVVDVRRQEECDGSAPCPDGSACVACACIPPSVTATSSSTSTTAAASMCGNGVREPGEACDGADLGGFVCPEGGPATCRADCLAVDQTGCFRCGDGAREGDEACDLTDVGGALCDHGDETGGVVGCTVGALADGGCRLDRTTCWRCGNARLEGDEECDDGNRADGDGCSAECRLEDGVR